MALYLHAISANYNASVDPLLKAQMFADILSSNSKRDACSLDTFDYTAAASVLLKAATLEVQRYTRRGLEAIEKLGQCNGMNIDLLSRSTKAIAGLDEIATTILPKCACELMENTSVKEAQCLEDMRHQNIEPLLRSINCGGQAEKLLASTLLCSKQLICDIDVWFSAHAFPRTKQRAHR